MDKLANIYEEVLKLTAKPITAVAAHIHWDHIGGHKYFPVFYAHADELEWLNGKIPLSIETIREMVIDRCDLPEGFCVNDYELFQGMPTKVFPAHHSLDIKPEILIRMREAFRNLKADGKLHRASTV